MALLIDRKPLIREGWQRAAVFCVAFMGCMVLVSLIAASLHKTGSGQALSASTFTLLELFTYSIVEIVLVLLFCRFIDRQPAVEIGFAWQPRQPDVWVGLLLGPALLGAGSLILYANGNLLWTDVSFSAPDFFISLVLMLLVAVGEEMVVRGYLLRNLLQSMNKWVALGVSAALFASAHINNPGINTLAIVNLFLGGLLLGLNYVYTRNLWFAIGFHASWNFFQGPVLGYEVSGVPLQSVLHQELSGPGWLTGYQFGFEGSVIAAVVMAVVIILLYMAYERQHRMSNVK